MSVPIKEILAGWTKQHGYKTKKEAARALGYDWSKIHNWFAGHPCPDEECPRLLEALGCDTIKEATLKFALPDEQLVEVYPDFVRESGSTAAAHLHGAKVLRETRIMVPVDPPYRPDKLRLKVARLLQDQKMTILKLEQICSRERAVDLICNIKIYDEDHYVVGIVPYRSSPSGSSVLYQNFAIYADDVGDRSVMAVWLHGSGPDLDIPYLSAFGRRYAAIYRTAWETMWRSAERISGLRYPRTLQIVTDHLESIGVRIGTDELNDLVEERVKAAKQTPPRY